MVSASFTACARWRESCRFGASEPTASVWPSIMNTSPGFLARIRSSTCGDAVQLVDLLLAQEALAEAEVHGVDLDPRDGVARFGRALDLLHRVAALDLAARRRGQNVGQFLVVDLRGKDVVRHLAVAGHIRRRCRYRSRIVRSAGARRARGGPPACGGAARGGHAPGRAAMRGVPPRHSARRPPRRGRRRCGGRVRPRPAHRAGAGPAAPRVLRCWSPCVVVDDDVVVAACRCPALPVPAGAGTGCPAARAFAASLRSPRCAGSGARRRASCAAPPASAGESWSLARRSRMPDSRWRSSRRFMALTSTLSFRMARAWRSSSGSTWAGWPAAGLLAAGCCGCGCGWGCWLAVAAGPAAALWRLPLAGSRAVSLCLRRHCRPCCASRRAPRGSRRAAPGAVPADSPLVLASSVARRICWRRSSSESSDAGLTDWRNSATSSAPWAAAGSSGAGLRLLPAALRPAGPAG